MKRNTVIFISLIAILTVSGCSPCGSLFCHKKKGSSGETPKAQTSVVNPNGDSPLALLMREMTDDLETAKQKIIRGIKASIQGNYHGIMTARPTSDRMKNEAFNGYAQSLLYSMDLFSAQGDVKSYNAVVNACIACHKQSCPGPISRIKKLMIYL